MALLKPIFNLSEICSEKGIGDAIICPGSRSAALTIAFSQNKNIETQVLCDERSAAFVAMGKAQESGKTVALICTSGSAVLNFSPAISEAFFQEIPLLVLTADRPPEWINQYDGQTIFQDNIYGKHVKKSYSLPVDYSHKDAMWQLERLVNEAIDLSQMEPKGPVHINVPIREPFYPDANETFEFCGKSNVIKTAKSKAVLNVETWSEILEIWESTDKKMIAVGQNFELLTKNLDYLCNEEGTVIVSDIISNCRAENFITTHDTFLHENIDKPELLITLGKSFISKTFKQYIRKNKPKYHFHIQNHDDIFDPFMSVTHRFKVNADYFLDELVETIEARKFKEKEIEEEDFPFQSSWQAANQEAKRYLYKYLNNIEFGEMIATATIIENLPTDSILHLGNSMPVRYANLFLSSLPPSIKVFCNRGTSGIDGIISTAIGQAYKTNKLVTCLLGDVSFFYDINAFWNNNLPKNFRVILINNNGGNIFRIIEGPSLQPELAEFFVTNQKKNAKNISAEIGFDYCPVRNLEELQTSLKKDSQAIIEVFTDGESDANIFKNLKNKA